MKSTDEPGTWRLLGCRGWGSVLVESFLALCGIEPLIDDVQGFDEPGAARQRLLAVNPTGQVPTLILPGGTVMTESGAIALLLSERNPDAGLAPAVGHPDRAVFLRWLFWIVANVYPTFTYADYPKRYSVADPDALRERVLDRRKALWRQFESTLPDSGWVLADFSALDVYATVMTRWTPGRPWFAAHCPKLHALAERGDRHPVLGAVIARNFD